MRIVIQESIGSFLLMDPRSRTHGNLMFLKKKKSGVVEILI